MPPKKEYKDYVAARRAFAAGRSSASRQSMLIRPTPTRRYQAIPTERKYFDKEVNGTALAAMVADFASGELDPATQLTLLAPTTGDDFNNREGRKVHVLGIKLRGEIRCAPQADQADCEAATKIRLLLVQDKQTNTAQLNSEDVINSGAGSVGINMFQNPAFFGRFRVLKDKSFVLQNATVGTDGTNTVSQSGLIKQFTLNIKFKKPVVVHFNATNGGTIADIIDNSFHVIGGCSSTAFAPAIYYKSRVTFVDV